MNNKTVNKIVSVIIALFLWVFVMAEVNPVTQTVMAAVPVSLLNEESLISRGLAVAGDGEYTVDVVMEGQRADIAKISATDLVVTADLFGYGKGQCYLEVSIKGPTTMGKVEARPARIPVTIEELVAVSKPVTLEVVGLDTTRAEIGNVTLKPNEIEVTGGRSQVAAVHHVQVKADGGKILENGTTLQLEAVPVDASGMVVRHVELSAKYVELKAKLYEVKDVPLILSTIGAVDNGYTVESIDFPKTVKVKGAGTVLKQLESLKMEPINLEGLSANTTLKIQVLLPEQVELADENKIVRAGIMLKSIGSKEFSVSTSDVSLDDLPIGFSVVAEEGTINVRVYAEEAVLEQLTKNDILLKASLAQATPETVHVAMTATCNQPVSNVVIKPQTITVKVSEEKV